MMEIIAFVILAIVVTTNIVLAIFVFENNPKSATNIIFILLSVITTIWLVAMYAVRMPILLKPEFADLLLFYSRLTIFLAVPQSVLFFFLAFAIPSSKFSIKKPHLTVIAFLSFILMAYTMSPYVFNGASVENGRLLISVNPGMSAFSLFVVTFSIGAIYTLFRKTMRSSGQEKNQLRFVSLGILLMLGLIVGTIMIPVMIARNTFFVTFAPIYALVFLGMTAYAIIRHRLLEPRVFVLRTVSFIFFIFICAAVYVLVVLFGLGKALNVDINFPIALSIFVISIAVALSFQPVLNWIRNLTKKAFFRGLYERDELLSKLTLVMARTIDLRVMADAVLKILMDNIKITKTLLVVVDKYEVENVFSHGYRENIFKDAVFKKFVDHLHAEHLFIVEEMKKGELKTFFIKYGIEVVFGIQLQNNKIAILILGPKASGEIYSSHDINILEILAPEAGMAIQNAKSYDEIKQFSEKLERRVEERTQQLQEAHKSELAKAEEIAKLKDEFVFIAAHELRTPVVAIKGFLELMSSAKNNSPEDIRKNLDFIGSASTQLNELINELLEISRSEAGTLKMNIISADMTALINDIIAELRPIADKKGVKIITIFGVRMERALIDENKMKEIIINLISNAIKYNREGGDVYVTAFSFDNMVMVEVRDTGYGIFQNEQGQVFQKFFRSNISTSQGILGTGLGLFITRMLAEKMNGQIGFTSKEGVGSTFAVTIPTA